jgi:BirA family biotin operon repressor/biotin-[acetyl-CoA-carboxylase] ligase
LADSTFDRAQFDARLSTRRLGRKLIARAEAPSTNDLAWEAVAAGLPDGTAVVADAQTRGRGRSGRAWHTAPGRGLALSVLMHLDCDRRSSGAVPLLAGLAVARGLERLGVATRLKWPNDLLLDGRKVAGILCESRHVPVHGDVVVLGIGVNVAQRGEDFPAELDGTATSLALAGFDRSREVVAAECLNAIEPLWTELQEAGREPLLAAWRARADFWGEPVTVRTPSGPLSGIARTLDADGGLVLTLPTGDEAVVLAGDLELPAAHEGGARTPRP